MATTILSIETATPVCSIALHSDNSLLSKYTINIKQSHSTLLHNMIKDLVIKTGLKMNDLSAVAISEGPGSYTGLRIGLSSAKGLCYALNIPLIGVNTLEAMALQVAKYHQQDAYFCPMIDARRNEVFCLIVDQNMKPISPPQALILEPSSFSSLKEERPFYWFGNGASKASDLVDFKNPGYISDVICDAETIGELAIKKFESQSFEDVAYFEPNYLKEFYSPPSKKKPYF